MTSTAYDEVEARSRAYRECMSRMYSAWCESHPSECGASFIGKRTTIYEAPTPREADPFAADVYAVLGCNRYDPDSVIVAAYRRAAKRFHPDTIANPTTCCATEAMARINAAWADIRKDRRL